MSVVFHELSCGAGRFHRALPEAGRIGPKETFMTTEQRFTKIENLETQLAFYKNK